MDPKVKEAWIKALKSGRYQQGDGTLRINDKYCVLGVLCDIYKESKGDACWENYRDGEKDGHYYFQPHCDDTLERDDDLPEPVSDWAALDDESGLIPEEVAPQVLQMALEASARFRSEEYEKERSRRLSLISLNDGGVDFLTLAKIIEVAF